MEAIRKDNFLPPALYRLIALSVMLALSTAAQAVDGEGVADETVLRSQDNASSARRARVAAMVSRLEAKGMAPALAEPIPQRSFR